MKKRGFFSISIVVLFLISGCGKMVQNEDTNKINIGFILPIGEKKDYEQAISVMKKCAETVNNKFEVQYTDDDCENEMNNIQRLINQGAKVLLIRSKDTQKTAKVLDECKMINDKNVKIISCEDVIPNTDKVQYVVSYTSIKTGKVQGQYLVYNSSGKGNPLYLYAKDCNNEEDMALFEGAWKTLWPRIEDGTFQIMNSKEANRLKNKSVLTNAEIKSIMREVSLFQTNCEKTLSKDTIMQNGLVRDNGKKKYILAPDDESARKIIDCMTSINSKIPYYITGNGVEKKSLEYIKNDKQSMSIYQNKIVLAQDAITIANMLVINFDYCYDTLCYNGKVDVKEYQSEPTLVSKTNISSLFLDEQ